MRDAATLIYLVANEHLAEHSWSIELPEDEKVRYHWEGVAVVASTSVVGLLVVALRGDIVWTLGALLTLAAVAFGPYHNVPVLVCHLSRNRTSI